MRNAILNLKQLLQGELLEDYASRVIYATDASSYQELPLAVAYPKNEEDLRLIVQFVRQHGLSVLPRTAGTSLAGQVVGKGIILDFSRYWNQIIEVNNEERWVRVQPGVVRDELNLYLREHGLFFGPETATANRAMIGGMVGNNSCGTHSLLYGSTRDHVLSLKVMLSDGHVTQFGALTKDEFLKKCDGHDFENRLYRDIYEGLSRESLQKSIRKEYPKTAIHRRNTGYAVDLLLESEIFTEGGDTFNFCKLLCGSEGTLGIVTEIQLNLVDLPPAKVGVIAVHLDSIHEATKANLVALKHRPGAIELIDRTILECAAQNLEQKKNSFFVEGDPGALLIVEFERETEDEIRGIAEAVVRDLKREGLGTHYPLILGHDVARVWALRKSGMGILSNLPGRAKPVNVIDDIAVDVKDLPDFILELQAVFKRFNVENVYYAHIGDGEIHHQPIFDLKSEEGQKVFHDLASDVADLVKKYRGSLSGEHGDGRLRGEFVERMIGKENYDLLLSVKESWDPHGVLNPGKIVHAPRMDDALRYDPKKKARDIKTYFDYSESGGVLPLVEKCHGSGDCRKSHLIGGTMCPSFMGTRDEKDTTRARANVLRDFMTNSKQSNVFNHNEIFEVLDLCLSCKACKTECPSNVDMAMLKAEALQQYYNANGVPFRSRLIADFAKNYARMSRFPNLSNFLLSNSLTQKVFKQLAGIAEERSLPKVSDISVTKWLTRNQYRLKARGEEVGRITLFIDEYTNYMDARIGIRAIRVIRNLGYSMKAPVCEESGRTYISKGLLREARAIAERNVHHLQSKVSEERPLVGIEPSAILTFRDEYPKLVRPQYRAAAKEIAKHTYLFDEWLAREFRAGRVKSSRFIGEQKQILLHGHCHQKALSSMEDTKTVLSIPKGHTVELLNSGCCGMAGSFGYEEEHYDLSMKIAELVLLPAVRRKKRDHVICAPGTSCRHQIKDGAGVEALHPIDVLFRALGLN